MSTTRKIVVIFLSFLGVCLLALLIFFGRLYYVAKVNPLSAFKQAEAATLSPAASDTQVIDMEPDGTDVEDEEEEELPSPTPTATPMPADVLFQNERINVLMLGWDESPERTGNQSSALYRDEKNNFRSDVMILLAIDLKNDKVDMISIPRDSYASIYDTKGKWKINAAFAKGGSADGDGFHYAIQTVSALMGDISIPYYAGVNMTGIKALVDAMGGVDYDVDIPITLNGRKLETGYQHLNGQQVLDYCRARKGISTDIGRIDRQQRMLFSIFEQLQSSGMLLKIPEIYSALDDMIYTNLNLEQMAALAGFAMRLDTEKDMQRHTLEGQYMSAYGAQFYVLNQRKKNELIEEIYGFTPEFDKKHDISYVRSEMASRARAAEERAAAEAAAAAEIAAAQETSADDDGIPVESDTPASQAGDITKSNKEEAADKESATPTDTAATTAVPDYIQKEEPQDDGLVNLPDSAVTVDEYSGTTLKE